MRTETRIITDPGIVAGKTAPPAVAGTIRPKGGSDSDPEISPRPRRLRLLLVEDDDLDAEMFRRSLRRRSLPYDLSVVADGGEALEWLRRCSDGEFGDELSVAPVLIFLDINMSRMNGHEFLQRLREDERQRHRVVFVLSTSDDEVDVRLAYARNVAGYLVKNEVGENYQGVMDLIEDYGSFIRLTA